MRRFYITNVIGDGSGAEPFRTAVARHVTRSDSWLCVDGRNNPTLVTGKMLCMVTNPTAGELTAIAGDADITEIPFIDGSGNYRDIDDTISTVSAANRTLIGSRLDANHVPTDDLTGPDPIRLVVRRIIKRFLLRQILKADDWTELLDSTVSAMNAQKRNRLNNRLQTMGFDTSGITGTMTIRQAIRVIAAQTNKWIEAVAA